MVEPKKFSLVKPSTQTPFNIDFAWWKEHDNNWRVYLFSCLCQEHQERLMDQEVTGLIDWVDEKTGEVTSVDALQHILITHCAKQPEFLTNYTTVVDGVFKVFLSNGNIPLSPDDLSSHTGKPADVILRTLAGSQVYKGLRPIHPA
jgi:hypothetical protein